MKSPITLTALLATLLFCGCSKNNTNGSASLQFQVQTINPTAVVARTTAGNLTWTSGFGTASEIKFEAKLDGKETERKSQTTQKIDLLTPVTTLGSVTLLPGTYSEVEFKLEFTPSSADPAMELNGQFQSGGVTIPVKFSVTALLELKNEKNNVVVTDNSTYNALTTIDLSLITRGISEAMLNSAVRTGGVILISSSVNTSLYNIMVNNIHDSDEVEFEHD